MISNRHYGRKFCGNRIVDGIKGVFNYVFLSRNPIVMIVYILITYGGIIIFLFRGVIVYMPNDDISLPHIIICCIFMVSSLSSFLTLLKTDPGKIQKRNVKILQRKYPYDNILFTDSECKTCKMPKVSRSKHCALCNICVEKQDHHCIWINGCVGANNYRFFLWFLISHAIMCSDIAFITCYIYKEIILVNKLFETRYINYRTKKTFNATWGLVLQWLVTNYPDMLFVLVLCIAMGIALGFFFLFHVTMVATNQTTNESNKQSDALYRYERQINMRKSTLKMLLEDEEDKLIEDTNNKESNKKEVSKKKTKGGKKKQNNKTDQEEVEKESINETRMEKIERIEHEIKKIEKDIENVNKNFYDKGFKANLKEVLFPNIPK